jgi:hypothetical protein
MKKAQRKNLTRGDRLVFAVVGFFTVVYGYGKMLRGQWIYENWRGLDITAAFVIFLGVLFLLVAVFPWGRIRFCGMPTERSVGHEAWALELRESSTLIRLSLQSNWPDVPYSGMERRPEVPIALDVMFTKV